MTLNFMGPDAKAAVAALAESLKDQDALVRQYAGEALVHVGPEAKAARPGANRVAHRHRFYGSGDSYHGPGADRSQGEGRCSGADGIAQGRKGRVRSGLRR